MQACISTNKETNGRQIKSIQLFYVLLVEKPQASLDAYLAVSLPRSLLYTQTMRISSCFSREHTGVGDRVTLRRPPPRHRHAAFPFVVLYSLAFFPARPVALRCRSSSTSIGKILFLKLQSQAVRHAFLSICVTLEIRAFTQENES